MRGCDAVVDKKQLTLAFKVEDAKSRGATVRCTGRIVTMDGQAIKDAEVTVIFHAGRGSASSDLSAMTDRRGEFAVEVPMASREQQVAFSVCRDGYAGQDTQPMAISWESPNVDVGTVRLAKESSIRVRIVGPDRLPLHGAIVEPISGPLDSQAEPSGTRRRRGPAR